MSNFSGIQKIHLAIASLIALEAEAHGRFGYYEDMAGKDWVRNKFNIIEFCATVASEIKFELDHSRSKSIASDKIMLQFSTISRVFFSFCN